MRKTLSVLTFMVCLCIPAMAQAMEVIVEITGPQELSALKDGIGKTIVTRCIARGIPVERFSRLSVTISTLGDVISYDALLDATPPKAFHKDIKEMSAISPAIDEMITAIFSGTGAVPAVPAPSGKPAAGQESGPGVRLPFIPTSIAAAGERIFVSDEATVYELSGEKAKPLWKARGNNVILRIYPYGDDLIVLAKLMDGFKTYHIRGSEIIEQWNKAVIPLGSGLVSSTLAFDRIFSPQPFQWSQAARVAGSPPQIPEGLDFMSSLAAELVQSATGPEIISYNASGRLTINNGGTTVWTDEDSTSITSQYIDEGRRSGGSFEGDLPARYYVRPRIVASGGRIITFRNGQGAAGMVSRLNVFEKAQIIAYSPSGGEFSREVLTEFSKSYCVDIAIAQEKAAALIVQGKSAYVQFIGL